MCVCTCTLKKAINFAQRTSRWPRENLQCVTTRTGSLRVDPQEPWRQRLGYLLCPVWEHWTCWQAQGFPIINRAHKSKGLPAASLTRRVEKGSWEYDVPSMGWQGAICCCVAAAPTLTLRAPVVVLSPGHGRTLAASQDTWALGRLCAYFGKVCNPSKS